VTLDLEDPQLFHWRGKCARTCAACGCKKVDDAGRCGACGAVKEPPAELEKLAAAGCTDVHSDK
jgi:hypothetical protein